MKLEPFLQQLSYQFRAEKKRYHSILLKLSQIPYVCRIVKQYINHPQFSHFWWLGPPTLTYASSFSLNILVKSGDIPWWNPHEISNPRHHLSTAARPLQSWHPGHTSLAPRVKAPPAAVRSPRLRPLYSCRCPSRWPPAKPWRFSQPCLFRSILVGATYHSFDEKKQA